MIDLKVQEDYFKDHVSEFSDYGDIKVLDFYKPGSSNYRIRFIFEEDYCKLHISGDLGELIASNYSNMTYEEFSDFVGDIDYFRRKVNCHSRQFDSYNRQKAREDLSEYIKDYEFYETIASDYSQNTYLEQELAFEEFLDEVLEDFDHSSGIGSLGYSIISKYVPDAWEVVGDFGREEDSGILNVYMLAFKLAKERLNKEG